MQYVSSQESFSCSLGIDPALRVTYHPQVKKVKTTGGTYGFGSKYTTTSFEQAITIKNTRRTAVHPLVVRDQVPISRDERITIKVAEPKELLDSGGKPTVRAAGATGTIVTPRWALRDDQEDKPEATGEKDKGLVEWIIDLEAGTNVDVKLAWEVSAPLGLEWTKVFF